ncbi:5-bromo-4-chloroindolyl phosphate hydrolysis protein [Bacillus sp. THAF10]|uniref:5-bromo-4-chloroindolyl phosphate hydrolysis family protein n=1 Tax=Bacillus sp. THAF10 TaxID=2587848 RepID=UPI0012684F70|nr:5-bromo-4-chloroindolyl phosphate hydrolysis family protein [Bacillus sp. THAF10]QFT89188.1 5-bromo-4-chloroindolyl phosphate hydrolysis protein [Bacillus sp. THAF10]
MKRFFLQGFIIILSFNIAVIGFFSVFFFTGNQMQLGALGAFASFLLSYWSLKRKLLPSNELDKIERKEKKYVYSQVRKARENAKIINQARIRVRSIFMYQTITKIAKISNKVIKLVEKEPNRYRTAQSFFQQHLDSSAIIIRKYIQLLHQPVRTHEVSLAIRETEAALKEMERTMEKEWMNVLSGDINHLQTELKLINQNNFQEPKSNQK